MAHTLLSLPATILPLAAQRYPVVAFRALGHWDLFVGPPGRVAGIVSHFWAVMVLLALGSADAAVWLVMTLGRGWFWRTGPRLRPVAALRRWPSVAVIVPARDEAEVLPATLPALLGQRYPGPVRVIVVDDHSGDGTAALARSLAGGPGVSGDAAGRRAVEASGSGAGAAIELQVVAAGNRPAGWTGKLWALQCGLGRAADADFVLFTDADICHAAGSLARLVSLAETGRYDAVSLMAKLRTGGPWERLLIPAFVYFFAMLYPFRWVNRRPVRHAAAAGGCILVRRSMLEATGGLAAVRQRVIDDVSFAQLLAAGGARLWLGHGEEVRSVRPYQGLGDLWAMVARSAFAQLRHSASALVGTVVGLSVVFVVPVVCLVAGVVASNATVAGLGGGAWALMALTYLPMQRYYRLGWWRAATLPVAAVLYLAMTVDSARRHWLGRGAAWKGRHYGARSEVPEPGTAD